MVKRMADKPIIFALANPTPEITPKKSRRCAKMPSSELKRSDYPNQINNILCFPYIFRGALDAGASTITVEMRKWPRCMPLPSWFKLNSEAWWRQSCHWFLVRNT